MKKPWNRRKSIVVPDAELSVLKVLWHHANATVREITEKLYPRGDVSEYATVQKLLERLQARQCVSRRRKGRVNVYSATIKRDDLIRERLRDAADKLCDGSFTPLLTQLVDARRLSRAEVSALRKLVDQLDHEEAP